MCSHPRLLSFRLLLISASSARPPAALQVRMQTQDTQLYPAYSKQAGRQAGRLGMHRRKQKVGQFKRPWMAESYSEITFSLSWPSPLTYACARIPAVISFAVALMLSQARVPPAILQVRSNVRM